MLRIVLLKYLYLIINAGISNALDEGSFLWAEKRLENLSKDKESGVRPGRWTRSVFNWLHSPLINSIQEAFVADSIYENSPPATKYLKRSILKNTSHVNLEESFENEFFLWEDNAGNPLEFGLKQIQDVRPSSQPTQQQQYRRFNRGQAENLWEEPLVYEYNQDVKDVDTSHLSYHETYKLNDILKNKLHHAFHHVFTFKRPTKHPSIYYTLPQSTQTSSTSNCTNGICRTKSSSTQQYFKPILKSESQTTLSSDANVNEQNTVSDIISQQTFGMKLSSFDLNEAKKESSYYPFSSDSEGNNFTTLTTEGSPYHKNLSSIDSENYNLEKSKDAFVPLKHWFDFHKENIDGEEIPYFWNNNLNNSDLMKSNDIQKNASSEPSSHRKFMTVHHKRFLKYGRKNKRKNNKFKYPEGHSCQYELFNGNSKSSSE